MPHPTGARLLTPLLALAAVLTCSAPPARAATPTAGAFLTEALAVIADLKDPSTSDGLLAAVAAIQVSTGDVAGARKTAHSITQPRERGLAAVLMAGALVDAGDLSAARSLIDVVDQDFDKSMIRIRVLRAQAAHGDIDAARATARLVTDPFTRAHADAELAAALAPKDLPAALATADAISGAADVKVEALVNIADAQAAAGDRAGAHKTIDLAKAAARTVPSFLAPLAAASIAGALARVGDVDAAEAIATAAPDAPAAAMTRNHIILARIAAGDLTGATAALDHIPDPADRNYATLKLADARLTSKEPDLARRLIDTAKTAHAHAAAAAATDPQILTAECQQIASLQARAGDVDGAAAWARALKDPASRARALCGIAEALAHPATPAPAH